MFVLPAHTHTLQPLDIGCLANSNYLPKAMPAIYEVYNWADHNPDMTFFLTGLQSLFKAFTVRNSMVSFKREQESLPSTMKPLSCIIPHPAPQSFRSQHLNRVVQAKPSQHHSQMKCQCSMFQISQKQNVSNQQHQSVESQHRGSFC